MAEKRVLIVDDTMFMRMKLKMIVEGLGYQVVGEGANGLEAIKKYQELKPDIVTMDITMPEMDGIAALKEIKKLDPVATVVMVSALGQEEIVFDAIRAGASNFIVKPFQDSKVKEVLCSFGKK